MNHYLSHELWGQYNMINHILYLTIQKLITSGELFIIDHRMSFMTFYYKIFKCNFF